MLLQRWIDKLGKDFKGGSRLALAPELAPALQMPPPFCQEGFVDLDSVYMILVGRHTFRLGPSAWPLIGVAALVVCTRGPITIVAIAVQDIADEGLESLDAAQAFIGGLKAEAPLMEKSWFLRFAKGEALYLPFGHFPMCIVQNGVNACSVVHLCLNSQADGQPNKPCVMKTLIASFPNEGRDREPRPGVR